MPRIAKLEELQQGDFEGILEAMDGLPVVIRLIDPPLHEFLPNHEELLRRGDHAPRRRGEDSAEPHTPRDARARSSALREQNPMLGLRGIRLGLMIPDFIKMQTRAILNAAIARQAARQGPARQRS